ncbi:MAG: hypothetical protein MJZ73_02200 [Bacteroidaceae bacterium]|nr:hypothetical protein [Bacteroidaceae bacterium]
MKKEKIYVYLTSMLLAFFFYSCSDRVVTIEPISQEEQLQTRSINGDTSIDEYYKFPIHEGMEEWKHFKSYQDRVNACLIPQDIAYVLSAPQLARTCVEFPMAFFFLFYNDERAYFSKIIGEFNGFQLLLDNKEGMQEMINLYKEAKHPQLASPESNLSSSFIFSFFELLFSDDSFFLKLSEEQKIELKNAALEKYEIELSDSEWFSFYSYRRTILLLARIIKDISGNLTEEEKKVLEDYINNYCDCSLKTLETISSIILTK